MKKLKIAAFITVIIGFLALILSLLPFFQFTGAWLGLISLFLAILLLKWYRQQNLEERKVKKAIRLSIYALFFGFIVAGGCSLHSKLFYVNPLKNELAPIKKAINKDIQKTNKNNLKTKKK